MAVLFGCHVLLFVPWLSFNTFSLTVQIAYNIFTTNKINTFIINIWHHIQYQFTVNHPLYTYLLWNIVGSFDTTYFSPISAISIGCIYIFADMGLKYVVPIIAAAALLVNIDVDFNHSVALTSFRDIV